MKTPPPPKVMISIIVMKALMFERSTANFFHVIIGVFLTGIAVICETFHSLLDQKERGISKRLARFTSCLLATSIKLVL